MLNVGTKAPNFSAPDQEGEVHKLSDHLGQWVLLYFYPRDNTPGCSKEACSFRDNYAHFQGHDVEIIGVSTDSVESHAKFAQKYELPFPILSDKNKEIVNAYEANGLVRRISYLINPDGFIAKIYPKVNPDEHAEQVLADLHGLIQ